MDFSEGLLGFLPKKSFFAEKARKDVFRDTDGFWDVFRESDGFFRGRNWQFGGFMLILFRASDGNRTVCAVRRNFRIE